MMPRSLHYRSVRTPPVRVSLPSRLASRTSPRRPRLRLLTASRSDRPTRLSPPTSGEVKLDYKQEQLAKDARSYLDEIEGLAGGAADVVKKVQPVKDPLTIDHQLVESAANAIAKARQRAGLVKGRLDQLPENGAGVAALAARFKELKRFARRLGQDHRALTKETCHLGRSGLVPQPGSRHQAQCRA